MRSLASAVLIAVLLAAFPARAQQLEHPLQVLKVHTEKGREGEARASSGRGTIWLRNAADVAVDGVKVEIRMKTATGRTVQTIVREVGQVEAGRKKYVQYRWEDYRGRRLRPEIWIQYNGGQPEPVKFLAEPPVW